MLIGAPLTLKMVRLLASVPLLGGRGRLVRGFGWREERGREGKMEEKGGGKGKWEHT